MIDRPHYESQVLDHLGLVAGMFDELGIGDILDQATQQKAFDAPPVFSYAERDTFFQVSERLDAILATLRNPTNRVALVLTVGYFRATKHFFTPPFDPTDVAYVAKRLTYTPEQIAFETYDAKASAEYRKNKRYFSAAHWEHNS